ncbi:1418_t:CDS:1, partial [Funneliformis caledonium]
AYLIKYTTYLLGPFFSILFGIIVGNGVRDADILALVGMAPGNFRTEDQRLDL